MTAFPKAAGVGVPIEGQPEWTDWAVELPPGGGPILIGDPDPGLIKKL